MNNDTHSKTVGYILWIFGFMGAHRFYYGRHLVLHAGPVFHRLDHRSFSYPFHGQGCRHPLHSWPRQSHGGMVLLTFLGVFGIHRFYLGKWITGIIWLCTGGFFLVGWLYDLWTLNGQVSKYNRSA